MRRVQTTQETLDEAKERVEYLREMVNDTDADDPGFFDISRGEADALATLIERMAEWAPKKPWPKTQGTEASNGWHYRRAFLDEVMDAMHPDDRNGASHIDDVLHALAKLGYDR